MAELSRQELFESAAIPKSVKALVIPTIISQLISMVYNLTDTFFVGMLNDPAQSAAIAMSFPVFLAITALANLFGIGGSSLISRSLGKSDPDTARRTSVFSIYTAAAASILYSLLILVFKPQILSFLGARESTAGYFGSYLDWVVIIGGLPSIMNVVLAHIVRSEGAAKQASIGMSLGGLLNIILDPIFILPFGFNLQVTGAAIATMISNAVAMLYFVFYLVRVRKTSVISLSPKYYSLRGDIVKGVCVVGLPAALQTFMSVISNSVLNNLAGRAGDAALAAVGIVKKIDMLPMNVSMGFAQGSLPLIGYNFAAKNYDRMHKANVYTRTLTMVFSVFCVIVFEVFARPIVGIFINDPETVAYGVTFLRILCIATPLMAGCVMIISLFQATGKGGKAMFLSFFRKGVVDVPLMFLLNWILPVYGLLMVQPIVDAAAMATSFVMYSRFIKNLKSKEAEKTEKVIDV